MLRPTISLRWWRIACVLVLLATASHVPIKAQHAGGSTARSDHAVSSFLDATDFGHHIILRGPWLAAPGDDAAWAKPSFDDRQWKVLNPKAPLSAQGFGYPHSIWFRLRLHLRPDGPPAAVYVEKLENNYALYANGERIGGQGGHATSDLGVEHPPAAFPIPQRLISSAQGDLVLALRVTGGREGFLNSVPLQSWTGLELVHPDEVAARKSFHFAHEWASEWALVGFDGLVGLCGLVIWLSLRDQWEYLALAIWLFANLLSILLAFEAHLAGVQALSLWTFAILICRATINVGELEFMRLLLRKRRDALWLGLEIACIAAQTMGPLVNSGKLPFTIGAIVYYTPASITEAFVAIMLVRAALHGNRDAPLLLLPVFIWSFTDLYRVVDVATWFLFKTSIPDLPVLHFFSYAVSIAWLSDMLGLLNLMLIIVLRSVRLSREKADLAAEVAAAEELQLLLLSRASRPTPGYRVDTEYRPMQQVGGDFFLVQPCEEDDSLVAIVGDVSGKGLQAAMRVSMILGVLQREVMGQPDRVLHTLNTALLAQGDLGFTTACCVRLEADGSFCFANAGHLNPYVDGRELDAEGALPLGMDADATYAVCRGRLQPGQRLVMLSDGVLEARSRKGELLGFERMGELVRGEVADIAQAAQRFGQEDDITVLALALA